LFHLKISKLIRNKNRIFLLSSKSSTSPGPTIFFKNQTNKIFFQKFHTFNKTTFVAPFNSTAILTPESAFGITIEGGGGGIIDGGGKIVSRKD
jgi:hypothetical protein